MKVSIIIATYNAEKYVERALLSVIKQDYEDKEIIVIDGASTDNTLFIIQKYKEKISLLQSEPDYGVADARNKGIRLSTGDIIAFLAADDWYVDNHVLSNVVLNIKDSSDVYSGAIWKEKRGFWVMSTPNPHLIDLYKKGCLRDPASFFRRKVFDKYGTYDIQYHCSCDYEFWLRIFTNGANIQVSDQVITAMSDGGISSDPRKFAWKEDKQIMIRYGASPSTALIRYWKRNIRFIFVLLLRKMGIERNIRKILKMPELLSSQEAKNFGVDLERPWFLV